MTDNLSKKQRRSCMSKIRSKHTQPEKTVRKILRELGFKYKLYAKNLPGKPDIIVPEKKTAIYINGCFWHRHKHCRKATMPKTNTKYWKDNTKYWKDKLNRNVKKQNKDLISIKKLGWKSFIIWECQTEKGLTSRINKALA